MWHQGLAGGEDLLRPLEQVCDKPQISAQLVGDDVERGFQDPRDGRGHPRLFPHALDLAAHGVDTVLDAVLNERRLELAFEGHRRDDLMRNKIDLDRTFSSAQNVDGQADVYPYNGPRQIYYIPAAQEIAYNPLCEQND